MVYPPPWPEADQAIAKDMWCNGSSSGEIGRALSRTRNAVMGWLNRHGLTDRDRPKKLQRSKKQGPPLSVTKPALPSDDAVMPKPSVARVRLSPELLSGSDQDFDRLPSTTAALEIAEPVEFNFKFSSFKPPKALLLRREQCRYPHGDVGEPDFHFCDAERIAGQPYCSQHMRLCYGRLRYQEQAIDQGAPNGG